jgi:lipopolysaccharide transport system ATP-binding protein
MTSIVFNEVSLDLPIYNARSRSLKNRMIQAATGGHILSARDGSVIVRALDNISFQLNDGDRLGILGHNGAGKSTLLRMLSGVYSPTVGSIKIKGKISSLIDISLGTDLEATGRDNIYLRGCLLGMSKTAIQTNIEEIIEFTDLGYFIDMPLRTYSSGMNMRLAFAVSTTIKPEILLMDEWLSVGDQSFKAKAELRMNELLETTSILIIASHSYDVITNTCNKAVWLEHGKIKRFGDPVSIASEYFNR